MSYILIVWIVGTVAKDAPPVTFSVHESLTKCERVASYIKMRSGDRDVRSQCLPLEDDDRREPA